MISIYCVVLLLAAAAYGIALRSRQAYTRILFVYLLFQLVYVGLCIVLYHFRFTNYLLFHIGTPLDYLLLSLFYNTILVGKNTKRALIFSIPVFTMLSIYFSVFIQPITEKNDYIGVIESLLLACWILLFFREVLLFNQVTALLRYPLFWIGTGILLYATESLVMQAISSYLFSNTIGLGKPLFMIDSICNDIFIFLLGAGAVVQIATKDKV
jgi:hypothetical protein